MIYVVDDDASVCKAAKRLMKSADLPVQTYSSAEQFLHSCKPTAADCLLVDIQMPGMNGLDLQRHLRESGITVPVIFITAFDNDTTRDAARSAGAAGYFSKPFDGQALLDAIKFANTHANSG